MDTPKTDALEAHLDNLPRACAEERWPQLCRDLERENAKLREELGALKRSTETLTRDDVTDDETGGWSFIPALREGDVCRIERAET